MSTIEQTQQGVPAGTWNADTVHSSVAFEVPYAVATFKGEVPDFQASLVDGRLTGSARIASLQTRDENLTAHLSSPEFFDAERFPEVRFEGETLRREGDEVTIDGTITIKGVTKPATLSGTIVGPTVDHFGANRVGLKLRTTVDRTQFGMNWNMPLPNGEPALSNEVTLEADLTLVGA
ncbi:MAG TPA: YceI family protein [Gaiellaceae bacterium]